jgi:hypothetical protein
MPERILEESLGRAIDSVLRSLAAGPDAVGSAVEPAAVRGDEDPAGDLISHLCGHVAHALRDLGPAPYHPAMSCYNQPMDTSMAPREGSRLDVWR